MLQESVEAKIEQCKPFFKEDNYQNQLKTLRETLLELQSEMSELRKERTLLNESVELLNKELELKNQEAIQQRINKTHYRLVAFEDMFC